MNDMGKKRRLRPISCIKMNIKDPLLVSSTQATYGDMEVNGKGGARLYYFNAVIVLHLYCTGFQPSMSTTRRARGSVAEPQLSSRNSITSLIHQSHQGIVSASNLLDSLSLSPQYLHHVSGSYYSCSHEIFT